MAVVDLNTSEWVNNDGLLVLFNPDRSRPSRGGEYSRLADGQHMVSVIVDLATLPTVASTNEMIVADNVYIPNGALITKVRVTVLETIVGTVTLDFGLVDQDRVTEIDFDGLLAVATTGTLGSVTEYIKGTALAGILVGAILTNTGLLTMSPSTGAATDGTVKLDVEFYVPLPADL